MTQGLGIQLSGDEFAQHQQDPVSNTQYRKGTTKPYMYPNKRSALTLTVSFPVTEWFVSLRLLSDDEPAQVRGVLINFTTKSYRWIPKYYTNAKDRSEKDGQTFRWQSYATQGN